MNHSVTTNWKIRRYGDNLFWEQEEEIVTEYPLTIHLDGEEFATLICTPENLDDLVIGYLASEGIIRSVDDIASFSVNADRGFAYVDLQNRENVNKAHVSKRFVGSCCGKSREFYFLNDARTAKTVFSRQTITARQCFALMDLLQESSYHFRKTGGVHNAALCTPDRILISRVDIGRHNTLDKIFGYCLRHKLPLHDKVIVFSGRISSEVVLKTAKIGVGILLSKSAPSDLALRLAHDLGITVAGFIRGGKMNLYTHPERIIPDPVPEAEWQEGPLS